MILRAVLILIFTKNTILQFAKFKIIRIGKFFGKSYENVKTAVKTLRIIKIAGKNVKLDKISN